MTTRSRSHTEIIPVRFWNCGENAVMIVAVANYYDGDLVDWAAYIGIGTSQTEEECTTQVAERGCKLCFLDAAYFCHSLPLDKYRH